MGSGLAQLPLLSLKGTRSWLKEGKKQLPETPLWPKQDVENDKGGNETGGYMAPGTAPSGPRGWGTQKTSFCTFLSPKLFSYPTQVRANTHTHTESVTKAPLQLCPTANKHHPPLKKKTPIQGAPHWIKTEIPARHRASPSTFSHAWKPSPVDLINWGPFYPQREGSVLLTFGDTQQRPLISLSEAGSKRLEPSSSNEKARKI